MTIVREQEEEGSAQLARPRKERERERTKRSLQVKGSGRSGEKCFFFFPWLCFRPPQKKTIKLEQRERERESKKELESRLSGRCRTLISPRPAPPLDASARARQALRVARAWRRLRLPASCRGGGLIDPTLPPQQPRSVAINLTVASCSPAHHLLPLFLCSAAPNPLAP